MARKAGPVALMRRLRGDEASTLMEFAVTLPLVAIVLAAGTGTAMLIQARFAVQAAAKEAATIGAYTSTSIDPYGTAVASATAGAYRVLSDFGLDPAQASVSFDGSSPDLERGGLFQVQIDYVLDLPLPLAHYLTGGDRTASQFTVHSVAVLPIQQYKARWPCPSEDPICD